jgi:pimeloyl-ACP methyl ester carboxylesterase
MITLSPTVIVPGIMGSTLVNTYGNKKKTIWSIPDIIYEDINILRLDVTGKEDTTKNTKIIPGKIISIIFKELIGKIKNFQNGKNEIFEFPYDWRKDIRDTAQSLYKFLEKKSKNSDNDRLNLICHSMGGIIARYCLCNLGGIKFVDKCVIIGTPFKGSAFAIDALLNGVFILALINLRVNRKQILTIAWTHPALYQLLPNIDGIFDRHNWPITSGVSSMHLKTAEETIEEFKKSENILWENKDKIKIIAGAGEKTKNYILGEDNKVSGYDSIKVDGDDYVPRESAQLPGITTYVFDPDFEDLMEDPEEIPLHAILPLHITLPMYDKLQSAILDILSNGETNRLHLLM